MSDFDDIADPRPERPLIQQLGAVLLPSFFAAGIATVAFFAFVDPLRLRDISFPGQQFSREVGYTIGFFMFWAVTAMSSAVSWFLLRPLPRPNDDVPLG